ncbi:chorismate-binding protein [Chloroflexota bacterium]
MYCPTLEEFRGLKAYGNLVPVYREVVADLDTPISAFLKINRGGYSFLLESVEGGERIARYSFIGTEPYRVVTTREEDKTDPLHLIAGELDKYQLVPVSELPRFCGGAVGYLAYETVRHFEELPSPASDTLGLPESFFMFVDTVLVFDHVTHKIKIVSLALLDGDIDNAYETAVRKIDDLANRLEQPHAPSQHITAHDTSARPAGISSNCTRAQFEASVEKARQYITEGEAIQIVLSQRLSQHTNAHPFDIYRTLRTINPSPYMFFLDQALHS